MNVELLWELCKWVKGSCTQFKPLQNTVRWEWCDWIWGLWQQLAQESSGNSYAHDFSVDWYMIERCTCVRCTNRVWRRPCRPWEFRENRCRRSICSWWRPPCAWRTRRARRTWVWSASRSPWDILATRRWISAMPTPRDAGALLCRPASRPGSPSAPAHSLSALQTSSAMLRVDFITLTDINSFAYG